MKKYVAKRLVISVMTLLIILFVLFLMLSFMGPMYRSPST